ncbi:UvrD-helicase domain-containing protein [Rhodococcus pyridinivorans]|uniref:DNA 3'-5' helicase n=1 Tax=Rhodococcus pyridinivorans TaxID=103816 RepID=A0A7M2XI83_9NOCA|nr:UvrD-helicase domain-containing protein [Rhodococcus pyridinivorans]QOV97417.1 ATP-dependent helicase [Rhodococcus pyridinivorans]WMM71324.1 UvrD-helicase domain-containing protein [Rhodococcus pyridinivorans]
MSAPRVSAKRLAEALGQLPPTTEQAAVIEAPPGPMLVVAGAGAGKTETMAARVVWLVANGLVEPEQVLGLTFTRKAAQQLTARIRARLAKLAGSALLRDLDPSGGLRARILGSEPEVSTYHAYAGRLLTEHGLLLPIEPSATLLSETELWQVAHRVVSSWDGELDTDRNPASVTEAVLALSGQLSEHLVEPDLLRDAHVELEQLVHTLPPGPGQRGAPSKTLLGYLETQHARLQLLPLVERLSETLRREGALDFGSQMSLAARVARDHREVGAGERERFRAVLLDEYQDTGHAQRVLLAALFGGGADPGLAVTAVGDPMQSIYGWRGASAANLPRFATDFPAADGEPAPTRELLTSWRNPPQALELANVSSEPLRDRGVSVSRLRPRPDAAAGDVRLALHSDVAVERDWVADRIADEYAAAREAGRTPPTAAVLVRRNADAAPIAEALRARDLPVEVVGIGGLLHTPEVADVLAMLRLAADPLAGSAAVRVLTGARWQLGAADLKALWERAQELAIAGRWGVAGAVTDPDALEDALDSALPGEYADQAGLADAISDPGDSSRYSKFGYARIVALGRELTSLRERLGQPLTELVAEVERVLGIGIETEARVGRRRGVAGREHLDAFASVVASYAGRTNATLPGLLSYLAAAEEIEQGLAPGEVEVDPDRVQVLTVHSAKGLEWEVVAVPHVAAGVFPSSTAAATWLGSTTELPPHLRGDRVLPADDPGNTDGVPVLELDDLSDRKMLERAIDSHKDALKRRKLDEDRRLFYVALTRTERTLFVSAHHWADTGSEPKGPSPFLEELHEIVTARPELGAIDHWDPEPEPEEENPLTASPRSALWPRDPLGARRTEVERGAALVLAEFDRTDLPTEYDDDPDEWATDVDALLAEREQRAEQSAEVVLPAQLSVSQLVDLATDPDALAARLRRPLPFRPNPLARRGTAFHAWLERRFGATRLLDLDELPGADDEDGDDSHFDRLQEAFLRSKWASRNPVEVEVPFETALGGTVIRGRIDAVFEDPDGGWTVIDWKTGAEPEGEKLAAVGVQLAAYRLAWAQLMAARTERLTGRPAELPLHKVRAAFHYVRTGRTVAPEELPNATMLERLVLEAGNLRGRADGE